MKKAVLVFIGIVMTSLMFSQSKWSGFLYPIDKNPVLENQRRAISDLKLADSSYTQTFMRFNMGVSGVQLLYDKTEKGVTVETFMKLGFGLSYAFYRVTNGIPYNYLSINGYAFVPVVDSSKTYSYAITVSSFKFFKIEELSPSLGINFTPAYLKKESRYFPVGLLFNLKYNF